MITNQSGTTTKGDVGKPSRPRTIKKVREGAAPAAPSTPRDRKAQGSAQESKGSKKNQKPKFEPTSKEKRRALRDKLRQTQSSGLNTQDTPVPPESVPVEQALPQKAPAPPSYATMLRKNLNPALARAAHKPAISKPLTPQEAAVSSPAVSVHFRKMKTELNYELEALQRKKKNLPRTRIYEQVVETRNFQDFAPDAADFGDGPIIINRVPEIHINHQWQGCPYCPSEAAPHDWIKGKPRYRYLKYDLSKKCPHHSGSLKHDLAKKIDQVYAQLNEPHRLYTKATVTVSRARSRREIVADYYQSCEQIAAGKDELAPGQFGALVDLTWKVSDALFTHAPTRAVIRRSLQYFGENVWRQLADLVDDGSEDLYLVDTAKTRDRLPFPERYRQRAWISFDPRKAVHGAAELKIFSTEATVVRDNIDPYPLGKVAIIRNQEKTHCVPRCLATIAVRKQGSNSIEEVQDAMADFESLSGLRSGELLQYCKDHGITMFHQTRRKPLTLNCMFASASNYGLLLTTNGEHYHVDNIVYGLDQAQCLLAWALSDTKVVAGVDMPLAPKGQDDSEKAWADIGDIDVDDIKVTPITPTPKDRPSNLTDADRFRIAPEGKNEEDLFDPSLFESTVKVNITSTPYVHPVVELKKDSPFLLIAIYNEDGDNILPFNWTLDELQPFLGYFYRYVFETNWGFRYEMKFYTMEELLCFLATGSTLIAKHLKFICYESREDFEEELVDFPGCRVGKFADHPKSSWKDFVSKIKPEKLALLPDDFVFKTYTGLPLVHGGFEVSAIRIKWEEKRTFANLTHAGYSSVFRFADMVHGETELLYAALRAIGTEPVDARSPFNQVGSLLVNSSNLVNYEQIVTEPLPLEKQRLSLLDIARRMLAGTLRNPLENFDRWPAPIRTEAEELVRCLNEEEISILKTLFAEAVTLKADALFSLVAKLPTYLKTILKFPVMLVRLYATQETVHSLQRVKKGCVAFYKACTLAESLPSVVSIVDKTDEEVYSALLGAALAREPRYAKVSNDSPVAKALDPDYGIEVELAAHLAWNNWLKTRSAVESINGQTPARNTGVLNSFQ